MAQVRMLMSVEDANELARDRVVNTFYLDTDLAGVEGTDYEQLATDAAALWATYRGYPVAFNQINAKAYDMADAQPRLPRAEVVTPINVHTNPGGPREVALCLSYYAERNIPRKRGRMYVGPWVASSLSERPDPTIRQLLADLAEGISGLGGVNVQWVQYSPTAQEYSNVTNYWVDDEWDTQRSRGLRALTRTEGTVSG